MSTIVQQKVTTNVASVAVHTCSDNPTYVTPFVTDFYGNPPNQYTLGRKRLVLRAAAKIQGFLFHVLADGLRKMFEIMFQHFHPQFIHFIQSTKSPVDDNHTWYLSFLLHKQHFQIQNFTNWPEPNVFNSNLYALCSVVIDWRLCALYKIHDLWVKVVGPNLKHFPKAICQDVNKKALYFCHGA